jgi:hypothetical protein
MSYPVITLTQTGTGSTTAMVPDTFKNPFNIGIGCVVTGTVNYTIEHTFENVMSPTYNPATATWFPNSGITTKTANTDGNYAYPVNGIRLTVNSGTGSVTAYILQAGTR